MLYLGYYILYMIALVKLVYLSLIMAVVTACMHATWDIHVTKLPFAFPHNQPNLLTTCAR